MAAFGADVHPETTRYAILELALDVDVVLTGATGKLHRDIPCAFFCRLANAEAQLRPDDKEALHAASLASVSEVGKQGQMEVMCGALVALLARFDFLLPASLRLVKFCLKCTQKTEVFFAGVANGEACCGAYLQGLLDGGIEGHGVHGDASVHADGNVRSRLANLGHQVVKG